MLKVWQNIAIPIKSRIFATEKDYEYGRKGNIGKEYKTATCCK